jgi:hypothetical protein
MGITIDVESIVPHASWWEGPLGLLPLRTKLKQVTVQEICQAFNWQTPPWSEPAEYRGAINTSVNYSRYALVLSLAEGSFPVSECRLADLPLYALTDQERCAKFQHFLDHAEFSTFYLPLDFDTLKHLYNSEDEEYFTVGSAVRLAQEMLELAQIVLAYIEKYGADSVADKDAVTIKHTWSSLHDFCTTLYEACVESLELNLPVQILY